MIYLLLRCTRICLAQGLGNILYLAVRRSGFLAINGKGQRLACGSSLNIDRGTVIIGNLDIFISTGNGRIHRRLYIRNDHGMVLPLRHLKLRPKNHVIERGTQLAGASSDGIHRPAVLVGSGGRISVLNGKRRQPGIG